MMERGASFEPKGSLRDLLSDEEFREILAPFPGDRGGDGGGSGEVVLLLGEDAEDAERISAYLLAHGARAQPVIDRYIALDELRSHEFSSFVIAVESIGPDASRFLERVREARSPLRLGFIADPGAALPAWLEEEGTVVRRPLGEGSLARLFPWASPLPRGSRDRHYGRGEDEPPRERSLDRPPEPQPLPRAPRSAPPPAPVAAGRAPDWLGAVRALLEARRDGEPLAEALRRWAESEPGCAGWGEVRDQAGTLSLRAGGADRAALLAALAAEVAESPAPPDSPVTRGGFGCIPGEGSWTALWWRDPESGRRGFERFASLLPLVDDRGGAAPADFTSGRAPRDRLLRLLDARMHGTRRHGGSLALILAEPEDPASLLPLAEELSGRLRGEDSLELDAGRLWIFLERPDPEVAQALRARLAALPGGARVRALGASWRPGGEGAAELVARLEEELAAVPPARFHWVD